MNLTSKRGKSRNEFWYRRWRIPYSRFEGVALCVPERGQDWDRGPEVTLRNESGLFVSLREVPSWATGGHSSHRSDTIDRQWRKCRKSRKLDSSMEKSHRNRVPTPFTTMFRSGENGSRPGRLVLRNKDRGTTRSSLKKSQRNVKVRGMD